MFSLSLMHHFLTLAAAAAATDAPRVINKESFTQDTRIEAHHVVLAAGGRLSVDTGAAVTMSVDILEIRGPFVFDGRGRAGSAGHTNSEWKSSGPCSIGIIGPGEVAHRDWEAAGGHENDRGGNGGNAYNGATFIIHYREIRFSGVSGKPGDFLTFLTDPGAPGAPGAGRRLVCGCHPNHVKHGPAGNPGSPGQPGRFELRMQH